jgi:hypothetical protein
MRCKDKDNRKKETKVRKIMRKRRINNIRIKRNIKVRVSIRKGKVPEVAGIKAITSLFFADSNCQNLILR